MDGDDFDLKARAEGHIKKNEKGVLVIEMIEVTYDLDMSEEHRGTVERVHDMHVEHCPVAQSVRPCIDISTNVTM